MTPYSPSAYAICAAELGIRTLAEQQRIVAARLALRGEGVVQSRAYQNEYMTKQDGRGGRSQDKP